MTPEEIQQVRERCEESTNIFKEHYWDLPDEVMADVDALLAHIASLEARNEAMEGVVAAARRLIDADTVYEERRPLIDALAALDAQAGEVT